jgi:hypothetical protein
VLAFRLRAGSGRKLSLDSKLTKASLEDCTLMWVLSSLILLVWFILKFLLHKGGYVHILLILSLSMFGVQVLAYRKTQYHKKPAGSTDSV